MTVAVWAYPFDLADETPRRVVAELADLGVAAINCAAAYHSARVLAPRGRSGVVRLLEGPGVHVPLDGWPEAAGPDPTSDFAATAGAGFWDELATACREHGMALRAWTVLCHSSAAGARHPDAVVVNCFGDRYPWSLCPASPGARAYANALVEAIARSGWFDVVELESAGYLGYRHAHHHEMELVRTGPVEELLLSLCFCKACRAAAEHRGVDVAALQARVGAELRRRWAEDEASTTIDEAAGHLAGDADLCGLVATRQAAVAELLGAVAERCKTYRVALQAMAAVFAPTLRESGWIEGTDLAAWREHLDRFVVLGYRASGPVTDGWIAEELEAALAHWPPERLTLGVNLGPACAPDRDTVVGHVRVATDAGVSDLNVYHHGMLGEARLAWIRGLATEVEA